mmetsp:Transcript_3603/g.2652  ORF Transcript_3603/g.2652 Transcript_3603/m.2652 type:complete len:81 (+) Transcript_3603:99-341(+)
MANLHREVYETGMKQVDGEGKCEMNCALQCVATPGVALKGTEACLYKACGCRENFILDQECDEGCSTDCKKLYQAGNELS